MLIEVEMIDVVKSGKSKSKNNDNKKEQEEEEDFELEVVEEGDEETDMQKQEEGKSGEPFGLDPMTAYLNPNNVTMIHDFAGRENYCIVYVDGLRPIIVKGSKNDVRRKVHEATTQQ